MNGGICGWPNFRVRAQAFLSNRGETKLMAAAVAAAIGNHTVEDAQAKATQLLRYVTLDQITEKELAEIFRDEIGSYGKFDSEALLSENVKR